MLYSAFEYFYLYNNPSYSRILIGSRLWSSRGQTHDDSARLKFFFLFWIWINHNSLLSITTNQFASFCVDIRSHQCYFHVCQSGEIWNKKAFFQYILFFYCIKQIDSMLPCVCSVIGHRGRQNVIRTSVTHLTWLCLVCQFLVLTTFWRHLWSITEQTHSNVESVC